MFLKNGDAEIIGVVDPSEIEDEEQRKLSLSTALDKAKNFSAKETNNYKKAVES